MSAETDRNLLFGVLALQAGLLDAKAFAEACAAWAARKDTALAELLVLRGVLTAEDRDSVLALLACVVNRHSGDVHASLAAVAGKQARQTLSEVPDPAIQHTLVPLPETNGEALPPTLAGTVVTRERYALTRLHAEGGIGRVWVGRDEVMGREVALKELRPETASHPAIRARFLEEAKITGQL
jgi:eukaryotic-like serine/threonine-protein kinase